MLQLNKTRSRSSLYQQTLSSPKEILQELLKIDDKQIFMKEMDQMKEFSKVLKTEQNQLILMLEFLKQKFEEIEAQIGLVKSIKNNSANPSFTSLVDLNKLEEAKICIKMEIERILKKKNKDPSKCHDYLVYESNESSSKSEIKTIRLNVFYFDGSDIQPQSLDLKINQETTFKEFVRDLKSTLEIYEFSRFKLVLLNNKKEEKFINKLTDLNQSDENFIKIVPIYYKLKLQ